MHSHVLSSSNTGKQSPVRRICCMQVLPAVGHDVLPADTGWESGSDTPSAASSAGSDGSVSPELMRSTSRLLSGSFQLGFAGPS